jgi:hypothetical protein
MMAFFPSLQWLMMGGARKRNCTRNCSFLVDEDAAERRAGCSSVC